MINCYTNQVWVVWKTGFQTSKHYSKLPKLKFYILKYQYFTVIQVWKKMFKKNQVWKVCTPDDLRVFTIKFKFGVSTPY